MNNLAFQSATDLVNAIKSAKIQSSELLEHFIKRMQRYNPKINAIVATDLHNARERAFAADKALEKGENWGALHGLPVTIKDSFEVVGMPCTSGSPDLKDYQPSKNAFVVQKLLDEGAVIFGKTNLPLFAGDFQSYNAVYGQTNNPWNRDMVPGGSSGGAAAALAAGLTGLEMGSDIGGSIRNPAHFCGVFGHKPSFGIVPFIGHIPPLPGPYSGEYTGDFDIAVAGPLARSAKDLDLVMGLIASSERSQLTASKSKLQRTREKILKNYKIGLWLEDPSFPTDINVLDCLQNAVDTLAKSGARIEEKRPDIDYSRSHEMYLQLASAATSAALPQAEFEEMLDAVKNLSDEDRTEEALSIKGKTMLHRNWLNLNSTRMMMRETWTEFFKEFDILLCPTVSVTAFPHDQTEDFYARRLVINGKSRSYFDTVVAWAGLTGMVYLPSTIVPVGLAKNGLPVGMQIVAPYLQDRTSIYFAGLVEDTLGGFTPPPDYE